MKRWDVSTRAVSVFVVAAVGAAGCLGNTAGGSDSETHFACVDDDECRTRNHSWSCVRGYCQGEGEDRSLTVSAGGSGAGGRESVPPVTDGGAVPSGSGGSPPGVSTLGPRDPGAPGSPVATPLTLSGDIVLAPHEIELPAGTLRGVVAWYPEYFESFLAIHPADPTCTEAVYTPYGWVLDPAPVTVVPPTAELPGRYSVILENAPPSGALYEGASGGVLSATGQVLLYVDGNDNGTLDLTTLADGSSPDTVMGVGSPWDDVLFAAMNEAVSHRIYYAEADIAEVRIPAGLSVLRIDDPDSETLYSTADAAIVLDGSTNVRTLVCDEICARGVPLDCPESIADLPPTADAFSQCYPPWEGTLGSYLWRRSTCSGCRCDVTECSYVAWPGQPLPPGWPCSQ